MIVGSSKSTRLRSINISSNIKAKTTSNRIIAYTERIRLVWKRNYVYNDYFAEDYTELNLVED